MRVELIAGVLCAGALAVQALVAASGIPRRPRPAAGPALLPPIPEQGAWSSFWRITLGVVLARAGVLVLLGLTPLGAVLLVPVSKAGEALATPLTLAVFGGLAWLPTRLARPARARVERQLPALRPFRADGGSPATAWFRIVLLIGIVLLLVISQQTADEAVAFGMLGACLLAVVVLARVTRRLGLNRPVLLDDVLGPGQGVERLQAAHASLDLAASPAGAAAPSEVRLLVGRFRGRAVNAWATRLDRDWAVVVAPELLTRLDDAELRALLAHELGHLTVTGGRRRRIAVVLLALATALLALGLPDALRDALVPWLVTGLDDLPVAYGTALLTAMQLAVGYLAFVLLRPLVLVVHRADEAAADLGMLRMTADPPACARFLARQTEIFGLPYRWTAAQRLLVATHPSIGDRIAAVTAETVGGRS